jgi:hypothetical protein
LRLYRKRGEAEHILWGNRRRNHVLILDRLIPDHGSVPFSLDNHALELYRLFMRGYYDIYNNGGCNWESVGKEFAVVRQVYGLKGSLSAILNEISRLGYSPTLEKMGDVVLDAAMREQWPSQL